LFHESLLADEIRNVVIFLVDDLGVMDTSVPFMTDGSGQAEVHPLNQVYRTPAIENLASRGIRFNNFYAMSVCSPTRISIMTGQNAARHRTTNWINPYQNNRGPRGPHEWTWGGLQERHTTLPKLLQAVGYRTIHIGKGHWGPFGAIGADPLKLGFDINIGGSAIGHPNSYHGMKNYGEGTQHAVPHLENYHGTNVHLSDALTREAKRQISLSVEARKPFFLNFCHYAVHSPFEADPRFAANYQGLGQSAQAQNFATLVEGIDDSLGQLLDHLEELKIAEQTLIVFLGDNGSDAPLGHHHDVACSAPLRGKKATQYEGGVRVPLIVAWAKPNPESALQNRFKIREGGIQTQVASVCDLFPTILDLINHPLPSEHVVDGLSLQTLLTSEIDKSRPQEFLMHYPHEHRDRYFTSFRQGDWKVIYHYFPEDSPTEQQYQLYHLKSDPAESNNLAAAEPAQLHTMMALMIERLTEYQSVFPVDSNQTPIKPVIPMKN
jgi:arylsulfatase A-like enzyme